MEGNELLVLLCMGSMEEKPIEEMEGQATTSHATALWMGGERVPLLVVVNGSAG